jgi:hypothetical protein
MKQKHLHKINLFFLSILVLSLSISSVSAVFTENFDTDTAGTNPTAPWYTYYENAGATGVVSNTEYVSSPNSFKFSSAMGWSRYNLKYPCQPSFVNLTINVTSYDAMVVHDFMLAGAGSWFAEGWIADDTSFSLCYLDAPTFYPILDIIPNSWFNISFELNWTTEEFFLSGNNGSGWVGTWRPFASSQPALTNIEFGNVGAIVLYVDDMLLDVDILPEAQLVNPANNSWENDPASTDFSVHEWDNDTTGVINSSVSLETWDHDTSSWDFVDDYVTNVTSGAFHNGSFTGLCINRTYRWGANLTSDGDNASFGWWVFHTENITELIPPNFTFTFPDDSEYTSLEWAESSHSVIGFFDQPYNRSNMTCTVTISTSYYTMTVDAEAFIEQIDLNMDLRPYVFFDDTVYNISVNTTADFSDCDDFSNYSVSYYDFIIGDPASGLPYHMALADLSPYDGNFSQIDHLNDGVMFYACSNVSEPDSIPFTVFLTDWNGLVLNQNDGEAKLDWQTGWKGYQYAISRFNTREFYKFWIGVDYNIYYGQIQFDDLYVADYIINRASFQIADVFAYTFDDQNQTYQIFFGMNGTTLYTGVVWGFGTFAYDDIIPFHSIGSMLYNRPDLYSNDWGQRFNFVPGLAVAVSLIVIAFFSLIPVLITKSFPPMAIQLFFTEMGAVVAYAMGLFPIWVFEIALIAVFVAIFYKVFAWYRERQGAPSFADNPAGPELYKRGRDTGVRSAKLGYKAFEYVKSKGWHGVKK